MTTAPVLHYPDNRKQFTVTTDASGYAVGYVLSQIGDDGLAHPCIYGGRNLPKHARNWTTSEREMFGVLTAIKDNHVYLAGQRFKVETDHIANSFLERMKASTGRLGRWAVQLSLYNFEIVYRKGETLPHADAARATAAS